MSTPLLSRKWLLAMTTLVTSGLLCLGGYISDGVYSAVVIATVGAYLTANVVQKKA